MIENSSWQIGSIIQTNAVHKAGRLGGAETGAQMPGSLEVFSSLLLLTFVKF